MPARAKRPCKRRGCTIAMNNISGYCAEHLLCMPAISSPITQHSALAEAATSPGTIPGKYLFNIPIILRGKIQPLNFCKNQRMFSPADNFYLAQ